jgi:hypothetical protein
VGTLALNLFLTTAVADKKLISMSAIRQRRLLKKNQSHHPKKEKQR